MIFVVLVASKGHIGFYGPASAGGCVDVCGRCYHQRPAKLWPELLPEAMLVFVDHAAARSRAVVVVSVGHVTTKGHVDVLSPYV